MPKKIKIKDALRFKSTKNAIQFNHVSSTSFYRPGIAHYYEMVPGQKVKLDLQHMLRFDPLIKPFLGSCRFKYHVFFVPFRTVDLAANDYFADALHTWSDGSNASVVSTDRYVEMGVLQQMFGTPEFYGLAEIISSASGVPYDFRYGRDYYSLTPKGIQFMKLLNQLGYQVSFSEDDVRVKRSLYPLLSWLRIYHDWFYPEAYSFNASYVLASNFLESNSPLTRNLLYNESIFSTSAPRVLFQLIDSTLTFAYDDSYFISAFDNPGGPNNGTFSRFKITDPLNGDDFVTNDGNDTGYSDDGGAGLTNTNGSLGTISQFGINLLNSLSNYLRRHQLAGSRAIDRFLARFGFTNTPEKFDRSVLVGRNYVDVPIGDVMSHSDTSGAVLGDYSGQGASNANGIQFSYENNSVDYGALVVTYSVIPVSNYCQGESRDVLRLSKLDHWTPEFDGRTVEAIPKSMLLVSPDPSLPFGVLNTAGAVPYAFMPIYGAYKSGFDRVSGLFRPRLVLDGNGAPQTYDVYKNWHLMRMIPYEEDLIEHNVNSVRSLDRGQYNRVFYDTNEDAIDNMFVIVRIAQVNTDNMYNLFDDYNLIHDDDGKDVEIRQPGATMS